MADKPHVTKEAYIAALTEVGVWATPQNPIWYSFLETKPAYLPNEAGFAPFSAAHWRQEEEVRMSCHTGMTSASPCDAR